MAKQMTLGQTSGWLIVAETPEAYAPRPGDLICIGRGSARDLRYDDLPAGHFPAIATSWWMTRRGADQRGRRQCR